MSASPIRWSSAAASAQPPFAGVWLHAQPLNTVNEILRLGWDPEKLTGTIFGAAVYLSQTPWNERTSWLSCELDAPPAKTRDTFTSAARGNGSTDDHLIAELQEKIVLRGAIKKVGRTAGRGGNQQNTSIRDYFLSQNVAAAAFDETGTRVVAVYDPSVILVRGATVALVCLGRGGVETPLTFDITRPSADSWRYLAWAPGRSDFFEAKFIAVHGDRLHIEILTHNTAAGFFAGRGVPGAVFAHLTSITGGQIISSTNKGAKSRGDEFRSCSADRMWQGLAKRGRAIYVPDEDRYHYVP